MKSKKVLAIIIAIVLLCVSSACSVQQDNNEIKEQLTDFTTSNTLIAKETTENQSTIKAKKEKASEKEESTTDNQATEKNTNKTSTTKTTKSKTDTTSKKTTTKQETTSKAKNTTTKQSKNICYVTIECKSVLNNLDKLSDGHTDYIPKSGYYIQNYKYTYSDNDTVYNVLEKICNENNIKLSCKDTIYGTYIVGINNLDEKDCGAQSGWLYSVNETTPPVSCNKYVVNNNDKIVFSYTCEY